MLIIASGRKTGRTSHLIMMAAESEAQGEACYIVCHSHDAAYSIAQKAKDLNLNIGFPLTYDEFLAGRYHAANIKKFYLDNADIFLQSLTPVPIEAITVLKESMDEEI